MSALEKWSPHALTTIVAATGVAYWVMQHLLTTSDPFAVVNHPWQPAMLAGHVLAAPLLILAFGVSIQSHIRPRLASAAASNRISGLVSLATFGMMLVSGYALQVTTTEVWRRVWLVGHLASGATFSIAYAAHQVTSVRLRLRARRARRQARAA